MIVNLTKPCTMTSVILIDLPCLPITYEGYISIKILAINGLACSMTDSNTVYAKDKIVQDLVFLEKFSVTEIQEQSIPQRMKVSQCIKEETQ